MACWDRWAGEERGRNGQVDKWLGESGEGNEEKTGEGRNPGRTLLSTYCNTLNV